MKLWANLLPTFTFLSTNKLFLKFKIPELPTLIFFNMKIWKLKKYLVKMQVHKSKNAQYFNLLCLTSTQGSNYFCGSNLTLRFLVYILVLLSVLFGKLSLFFKSTYCTIMKYFFYYKNNWKSWKLHNPHNLYPKI